MKDLHLIPKFFEFELDNEGLINSVDGIDDTDERYPIVESLIIGWVESEDLIEIGEKTECKVWIENGIFIQGRVCIELGDDWDTDVWEDFERHIEL